MEIASDIHLTYCTNIHPGENWGQTFEELKKHLPQVKQKVCPDKPFGVGLRLSAIAASELFEHDNLQCFKDWLEAQHLYVFTINGFPYGGFHFTTVKDKVHEPDWRSNDRLKYTFDLIKILAYLLPKGLEGSISTSPLSYSPWFENSEEVIQVKETSAQNLLKVADVLKELETKEGILIHLDLEPEPDGFLENSRDVTSFFNDFLLKSDSENSNLTDKETLRYIRICYDVCHFALAWEKIEEVVSVFKRNGILIGKIQISAALEISLKEDDQLKSRLKELFEFGESTYLHQVTVGGSNKGLIEKYSDLTDIKMDELMSKSGETARVHFHVPVFLSHYERLQSTQKEILRAVEFLKLNDDIARHWEVETYTWHVLPEIMRTNLDDSIAREIEWVRNSWMD